MAICKPGIVTSPDTDLPASFTSQSPELWEIDFCCLRKKILIYWTLLDRTLMLGLEKHANKTLVSTTAHCFLPGTEHYLNLQYKFILCLFVPSLSYHWKPNALYGVWCKLGNPYLLLYEWVSEWMDELMKRPRSLEVAMNQKTIYLLLRFLFLIQRGNTFQHFSRTGKEMPLVRTLPIRCLRLESSFRQV